MKGRLTNAQKAVMGLLLHGFPVTSVPWAENPPYEYWRMVCEYIPHPRISTLNALHCLGFVGFIQENPEERRYYLTPAGKHAISEMEKTA